MKYFIWAFLCILKMSDINGQESDSMVLKKENHFKYSGSIDGYYSFHQTLVATQTAIILNHNRPSLGSFNLALNYESEKFGAMLHLAIGPRANQFYNRDENEILKHIRQSYLYYTPFPKLKISIGTINAFTGYEYNEPHLNINYSQNYLNSYIPAMYTGVWSDYTINDHLSWSLGLYNDSDRRIDLVPGKHIGSMISFEEENYNVSLSIFRGREEVGFQTMLDLMSEYQMDINNNFALEIFRAQYEINKQYVALGGVSIYYNHTMCNALSIGIRGEYFIDSDGLYFDLEHVEIFGLSVTGKYKWQSFYFMPELRIDEGNTRVFDAAKGLSKNVFSASLGMSYIFGT